MVLNIYRQEVSDVIEFYYNEEFRDLYSRNGGKIGTQGFECEGTIETDQWHLLELPTINLLRTKRVPTSPNMTMIC